MKIHFHETIESGEILVSVNCSVAESQTEEAERVNAGWGVQLIKTTWEVVSERREESVTIKPTTNEPHDGNRKVGLAEVSATESATRYHW